MPTIYRKTAKGVTEVETREHRLAPRVRGALILVDGKRDVAGLKGLIPQQAEETLAMLLGQGFIEVAGASNTAPIPTPTPPSAAPESIKSKPVADFASLRRAAVRELNDTVGPSGETLAIRMERARDVSELRPLVEKAVQVIANARGRAAAEAYAARHAH